MDGSMFIGTWWSLVPPLLAIALALITKEVYSSLFIGVAMGALLATFLLGVLIFVDDYFNCLTVGSVMRPVTDKYRVSRAKLAYIIDATAAPVCIIAPIAVPISTRTGRIRSMT